MDANQIVVTDENGNERVLEVLFTFNCDETEKQYVLYYDPSEEQPTVFASSYDEQGGLYDIESPEEWDMIEEVFNGFMVEDECECDHDEHECCHGSHGCCCEE